MASPNFESEILNLQSSIKSSVIITVKNEASTIGQLLDSLAAQTLQPDELIICDGGSADGTPDILRAEKRLPLTVILRPGANISQGRNAAIQAASGDVIAVTDAGVRLDPHWLEELISNFRFKIQNGDSLTVLPNLESEILNFKSNVVSGFFVADPQMPFEVALGATILPQLADINPASFMPSSRSVAFTKAAWQAVGGYPDWLDFCEDLVFDFALRKLGPFVFAPKAIAHFRPRQSLGAFFKQYYQYARGDGKANLFLKRHIIRYFTYLIAAPLVWLTGALISPWWWGLYLLAGPFMFLTPYKRLLTLWHTLSPAQKIQAGLWIPVIRITGDLAKMLGYPVGVGWRLQRRL